MAVLQSDFFSNACFFVKQENQRDEIIHLLPSGKGDDVVLTTPVIGKHVRRESEVSRIRRSHDKRIHRRKPLTSGHHQECETGKEQVDESFHGLICQFSDFYLDVNDLRLQRKQKTHTNTTIQPTNKNARIAARRLERKTRPELYLVIH